MENKDYVIYNRADNKILRFSNKEVVLYADKQEAIEDLNSNEEVLQIKDLPKQLQKELLKYNK